MAPKTRKNAKLFLTFAGVMMIGLGVTCSAFDKDFVSIILLLAGGYAFGGLTFL